MQLNHNLTMIFIGLSLFSLIIFPVHALAQKRTLNSGLISKIKLYPYEFEIETQQPAKIQGTVQSSGVNWVCRGRVCSTKVQYPRFDVNACQELAAQIGQVSAVRLRKQPSSIARVKGYPFTPAQITKCNQGVVASSTTKLTTPLATRPVATPAPNSGVNAAGKATGEGANRARTIGEASDRMKQAKELQRLRDLGSPVDQATGGGAATGRQQCPPGANSAQCLRDNLHAGNNAAAEPSGGSMRDCIMGPNPQNCFNRGSGKRPGSLSAGPGDPRDQIKDPRGVAALDITVGSYHSGWINVQSRWETDVDGGQVTRTRRLQAENGDQIIETVTFYGDDNTSAHAANVRHPDGSEDIYVVEMDALDHVLSRSHSQIPPHEGSGPSGQAAPDSASGGRSDNCNWNPALGKCMTNRPNPKDMTSQPGVGGQNNGGLLEGNTPKTEIGAAINCGDASNEACNRAGAGLSNRAKPIDHKDPGPTPGDTPH